MVNQIIHIYQINKSMENIKIINNIPHMKGYVVMLPTDKESSIITKLEKRHENDMEIETLFFDGVNQFVKNKTWQPQYLYILSDEEIKKGYCYDILQKEIIYYNGNYGEKTPSELKKIIATTNPDLTFREDAKSGSPAFAEYHLPSISNEFIREFVDKAGGIFEVWVAITGYDNDSDVGNYEFIYTGLKILNNTISIRTSLVDTNNWEYYFKQFPKRLEKELEEDYLNRCYTWSKDHFKPPIAK